MKIVVTGATGQLGYDIAAHFQRLGHEVHGYSSKDMNITDMEKVQETLHRIMPSLIIHSAAYTQVDQAETDVDQAFQVNAMGSLNVAMAASEIGAKLVYISTDYVFEGNAKQPYQETDPTNPQSVYGKSKLAGEQHVRQLVARHYILRTSWVFGMHGNNFVKTMLKLGAERDSVNVVHDQVGSPTYTKDLAAFIAEVSAADHFGTYHVSNSGVCSWYDFAKAIFEYTGNDRIQVNPVTTSEFPRPAPRPAYSVMEHSAIRLNGYNDLRHWKEALGAFMMEYAAHSG